MGYRVIGDFAAVTTGEPDGNGVVQILERGAVVPDGVHQSVIDHLVTVGQIEHQPEEQAEGEDDADTTRGQETGDPADGEDSPVLSKLDLNGLRALAADRGVDLTGITKKADIIAALEAAQ